MADSATCDSGQSAPQGRKQGQDGKSYPAKGSNGKPSNGKPKPAPADDDEGDEDEALRGVGGTPSEAVAIGGALEEYEREKAKERQREGGKKGGESKGKASAKLAEASCESRQKVAAAVGMSHATYAKAKEVVTAAAQDPEAFGDLPKLMAYSINTPMARASIVVSSRPGAALASTP